MIKFNNVFKSANDIEVVIKLRKYKKSYYDVEFVWDSNVSPNYFGSIGKEGSKWIITTNQDNYWDEYIGVSFKTLTEAITYIGKVDIEDKDYFNIY